MKSVVNPQRTVKKLARIYVSKMVGRVVTPKYARKWLKRHSKPLAS